MINRIVMRSLLFVSACLWGMLFALWHGLEHKFNLVSHTAWKLVSPSARTVLSFPLFGKILVAALIFFAHAVLYRIPGLKKSERMLLYFFLIAIAATLMLICFRSVIHPVLEYKNTLHAELSSGTLS
jgi:apolipoprotein N-acyltransferase